MRLLTSLALGLLVLGLAGCGKLDNIPTSMITIRNASNNLLLSTPDSTGTLALAPQQTTQIRVYRTYSDENNITETDDVTHLCNFNWEMNGNVALADNLGNITGIAPGSALLEVKFRPSVFDPWDFCRLRVEVEEPPAD
jgi:hypothetical protein